MHDEASNFLHLLESGDTGAILVSPQMLRRSLQPRGHSTKIAAALDALGVTGQLPELLRQCEIIERCDKWFEDQGLLAHERPHRSSYVRFWRRKRTK